jgi:hypothetical protein
MGLGTVLSVFSGPYAMLARVGVIAIVALSLFAYGWFKGNAHGTEKLTKYIGEQAVQTVRIAAARERIVTKTEIEYRDRTKTVYLKGETIVKEVTRYVTKADDAGCVVPVGFVRQFNSAWTNTPAGPPAESDRGPSGVPLSEASSAEAHNATSCHIYKEQRDGLIKFYREQQEVK